MRAFVQPAVRDLVALALTYALVSYDAFLSTPEGSDGLIPRGVAVLSGVMITVVSFLLHEWGHWLGAVLSSGPVSRPPSGLSPFLFHFDTAKSTRTQFLWMSIGGYIASIIALMLIVAWADLSRLSAQVATVLVSLGVLVTFVLEVPTTFRVLRGAPLPKGGVYETARTP